MKIKLIIIIIAFVSSVISIFLLTNSQNINVKTFYRIISYSVAIVSTFSFLYDTIIWRKIAKWSPKNKIFEFIRCKIIDYPYLDGEWEDNMLSLKGCFKKDENSIKCLECDLLEKSEFVNIIYIKQYKKEIKVILSSKTGKSETYGAQLINNNMKWELIYFYEMKPISSSDLKSNISHEGCVRLFINTDKDLYGYYWTRRCTLGDMKLKKINKGALVRRIN